MPSGANANDILSVRVEYLQYTKAVLMKGTSIFNLVSRYDLAAGQTYTATRNMNFYFVFEAEQIYTGQFVFTIWFSNVAGSAPLP